MGGFYINLDFSGIIFGMVSLAILAVGTIELIVSTVIYRRHKKHRPSRMVIPRLWMRSSLVTMGLGAIGILIILLSDHCSSPRAFKRQLDHTGAPLAVVALIGVVAVTVVLHDHLRRKR